MRLPLPLAVATFWVSLFLLERARPLRLATARLPPRLLVNLGISALAFATAILIVRPVAERMLQAPFGLLRVLEVPAPIAFVPGFLLLDFAFYHWHRVNHRIPLLWRFHNVHHIDPDLDVTTAFRFHPGEIAWSSAFRVVQIALIGPSFATFAAYEAVFHVSALFQHSNLRLPIGVERMINLLCVTPRMHGIHHSQAFGENNSNYGTVFPWWDRFHDTLRLNIPQAGIVIGVPGYTRPGDNAFWQALALPFRTQRDYWQTPEGKVSHRSPEALRGKPSELAE